MYYLQKRVDDLSKGAYGHKWKGCDVYKSYQAMLEEISKEKRPDAMIIGVPPMLHGERVLHEYLVGRLFKGGIKPWSSPQLGIKTCRLTGRPFVCNGGRPGKGRDAPAC